MRGINCDTILKKRILLELTFNRNSGEAIASEAAEPVKPEGAVTCKYEQRP